MPTSCSPARAIPVCRSRCDASRSNVTRAGRSLSSPTISNARQSRDCATLQESLADRTAVPLDQAASQSSQVHGQERQRHSSANHCCDDRLSAPASRAAPEFLENAGPAPRRTRLPTLVLAKIDRRNRHPATSQSEQTKAQLLSRSAGVQLCVTFPGTALRLRGRSTGTAGRVGAL